MSPCGSVLQERVGAPVTFMQNLRRIDNTLYCGQLRFCGMDYRMCIGNTRSSQNENQSNFKKTSFKIASLSEQLFYLLKFFSSMKIMNTVYYTIFKKVPHEHLNVSSYR